MIILTLLVGALPVLVAAAAGDSLPPFDSSASVEIGPDSTAVSHQPAAPPPHPIPTWSTDYGVGMGMVAVDFPERDRFGTELSNEAASRKWVVDQPFTRSDLGPRIEAEVALRRKDLVRFAWGGWWQGWSAQAVARDSQGILIHRSYGSDIAVASLGADLLISPSFLRLDAGRDAYVGVRWLLGAGWLEGRRTVRGWANGFSLKTGAEFLQWRRGALAAHLALDGLTVSSDRPWSDVLWSTAPPGKASWSAGGLSLGVQVRWGAPRDTATKAAQKK